jgi:hypothetical protein
MKSYKISCFGAGFVGIPTTSVLALYNPHLNVTLVLISLSFLILIMIESECVNKINPQFFSLDFKKL